jgi:hypothetical protein
MSNRVDEYAPEVRPGLERTGLDSIEGDIQFGGGFPAGEAPGDLPTGQNRCGTGGERGGSP